MLRIALHFLVGGLIVASVYHYATVAKDPALAAILGAFPLTILCCYIIHDRRTLGHYAHNMLTVLCLTFVTFVMMMGLVAWTQLHPVIIVTIILGIWTLLQWLRYEYTRT